MKNPALTADLGAPCFPAKSDMDILVHRARTTMRPKRGKGRKKIVLPGFKEAYQSMQREVRKAREEANAQQEAPKGQ